MLAPAAMIQMPDQSGTQSETKYKVIAAKRVTIDHRFEFSLRCRFFDEEVLFIPNTYGSRRYPQFLHRAIDVSGYSQFDWLQPGHFIISSLLIFYNLFGPFGEKMKHFDRPFPLYGEQYLDSLFQRLLSNVSPCI
jgi:hypothetical protein